jgi:hypothetical protein
LPVQPVHHPLQQIRRRVTSLSLTTRIVAKPDQKNLEIAAPAYTDYGLLGVPSRRFHAKLDTEQSQWVRTGIRRKRGFFGELRKIATPKILEETVPKKKEPKTKIVARVISVKATKLNERKRAIPLPLTPPSALQNEEMVGDLLGSITDKDQFLADSPCLPLQSR